MFYRISIYVYIIKVLRYVFLTAPHTTNELNACMQPFFLLEPHSCINLTLSIREKFEQLHIQTQSKLRNSKTEMMYGRGPCCLLPRRTMTHLFSGPIIQLLG